MSDLLTQDQLFQEAVSFIDSGDADELKSFLSFHPDLVKERLVSPGSWLRDKIGSASDGFFRDPYLLWFVAEDPVRNDKLPPNIAAMARIIIDQARQVNAENLPEQLDYALRLVAWSWVADRQKLQIPLLDVLIDSGAALDGVSDDALVNRHFAAASHLIRRGGRLTLSTALCLGLLDEADKLAVNANSDQKQFSLSLMALNGKAEAIQKLIGYGVNLDLPSNHLYSHATPLHHAVCSGSLETVKMIVDAGAKLDITDSIYQATPISWAQYYQQEGSPGQFVEIEAYLHERGGR